MNNMFDDFDLDMQKVSADGVMNAQITTTSLPCITVVLSCMSCGCVSTPITCGCHTLYNHPTGCDSRGQACMQNLPVANY